MNIISPKYGWYLARVNASIENFASIVAASLKTIHRFNLQPGRNVKISNFVKDHSRIKFPDRFILLPYFKEFIKNYWLLQDIIQSLTLSTFQCIDNEYIHKIIKLINTFYQNQNVKRELVIKKFFEFDNHENVQINIAMPESWLNENSVDLGETVLLRNDMPSPIIL
ncbi:MAG: hypothetical protein ACFFG0_14830 [Candidatus Thorarchaeota archaeon]